MREIESSVRDVFEPIVGCATAKKKDKTDQHTFEIRQILMFLAIPETDPVARAWLEFAGKENGRTLHRICASNESRCLDHDVGWIEPLRRAGLFTY